MKEKEFEVGENVMQAEALFSEHQALEAAVQVGLACNTFSLRMSAEYCAF